MKTVALLSLALAGMLISRAHAATEQQLFRNYRAIFRFIVSQEDVPENNPDLFQVAAESVLDYVSANSGEWFLVVKPDLLNRKHVSVLRGAQGNGPFYVFRETPAGFRFLGSMFGNGYKVGSLNGRVQFRTASHVSAEVSEDVLYEVDGNRLIKK